MAGRLDAEGRAQGMGDGAPGHLNLMRGRSMSERPRGLSGEQPGSRAPGPTSPARPMPAAAPGHAALLEACREALLAGRYGEAAEMARRILEDAPDCVLARFAIVARSTTRPRERAELEESLRLAREILDRHPRWWVAHLLMARAAMGLGSADARQYVDSALELTACDNPEYAWLRVADAMLRLRSGDLAAYPDLDQWKSELPGRKGRFRFVAPRWNGGPIEGRTVLLHTATDGDGDAIQMARFIPMVKARGAIVVVLCSANLARLFARVAGIDRVVAAEANIPAEAPCHDCQAALMSLPGVLGISLETIPACPYLTADSASIDRWRPTIGGLPGLRVGVAWQGNPEHTADGFRSFAVAALAPLAAVPGVTLVSLQKSHGADQLERVGFPVVGLGEVYQNGDWLESAAVVSQLDLVVAADTAIGHLAGALGKPVWTALPNPADWRWMNDRDDSPWYPTMRLFRQDRLGEWDPVFRKIVDALGAGTAPIPTDHHTQRRGQQR